MFTSFVAKLVAEEKKCRVDDNCSGRDEIRIRDAFVNEGNK